MIKAPKILFLSSIGLSLLLSMACRKVYEDLSDNPRYSFMLNKEFRTKEDMLLFQLKSSGRTILLDKIGGSGDLPDKAEMKKSFPFNYYGTRVLNVLPQGSEFRITRIFLEGSTGMSFIRYNVVVTKSIDSKFVNLTLEPSGLSIADSSRSAPQFDSKYIEEILSSSPTSSK